MRNHEMTLSQVLNIIETQIEKVYKTQKAAAREWDVSETYLSEVRSGKQMPGKKILDALDIEHLDKYRYKKK